MSIIQEGINQVHTIPGNPTLRLVESVPPNSSTSKKANPVRIVQKRWIDVNASQIGLGQIESNISNLNAVASSIRVADSAMSEIEKNLDEMKAQLGRIPKNYPPFPPESEERVRLLRSIATLRRLIDQLTMPPDDSKARKIMADPALVPEAGDWQIEIGDQGVIHTIHSQQVHAGSLGLNIPDLPEDATDEQIGEAIEGIDRAKTILNLKRNSLAADAMGLMQWQSTANTLPIKQKEFESEATLEAAIGTKNAEVKEALADVSIQSLTQAQSQLLLLLR